MDSILDPEYHARLVADLDSVCQIANVPQQYVHQSMKTWCKAREVEWVKNLPTLLSQGTTTGLLLDGVENSQSRCLAIAGAFLRNYTDARVISLNQLIQMSEKDHAPDPTVLVIPNLFLLSFGKTVPAWKIQTVYDLLMHRMSANRATVVFVENKSAMEQEYGGPMAELLSKYWQVSE